MPRAVTQRGLLLATLALAVLAPIATAEWGGLDCAVDEALGLDDPNNVYSCKATETCCKKKLKPACCAERPVDEAMYEQIALWGTLLTVIVCLALFIWFCRSDESLLDAETPCLQKFCCCCGYKKRGDDGHLHDNPESLMGSMTSLRSGKTEILIQDEVTEGASEIEDNAANLEAVLDPQDDAPAEDPPAEDPPAEDPPAEDPPAEDPPAEDPPAEDPPAEDPPAEDPPAEDPPAE